MVIYNLCLFCAFFPMLSPLSACRQNCCFHTEDAYFVVVVVVVVDRWRRPRLHHRLLLYIFFLVFFLFFVLEKKKTPDFSSENTHSTFREKPFYITCYEWTQFAGKVLMHLLSISGKSMPKSLLYNVFTLGGKKKEKKS